MAKQPCVEIIISLIVAAHVGKFGRRLRGFKQFARGGVACFVVVQVSAKGKERVPDPAALFMEIIPFYLFRIDHSAFSRFEETPIGNWDVWLNVINVEADGGAREGDLFAAFYRPSQHADNWREQMMFASTVLDPLVWSGLLIEVKPPKGKRADSEYFKTPLWRKALTLDTDGALMPRSEYPS